MNQPYPDFTTPYGDLPKKPDLPGGIVPPTVAPAAREASPYDDAPAFAADQPTLEIRNISKSFSGKPILRNISLTAYPGEIIGFLGPNGSGKTTTIKLVLGLLRLDAGSIRICGKNIEDEFEAAMKNVGGIIENPELYKYLTGRQNLECYARMYDEIPEGRLDELIKAVHLENWQNEKISKYSLGMRQRLGVAQALVGSPKLLILDEPTNGLDPVGIKELRDILLYISHEQGVTVFISSHLLSELDQLCDRVAIIDRGEVLGVMTMDEIRNAGSEGNQTVTFAFLNPAKAKEIFDGIGVPYTETKEGNLVATMRDGTLPECIKLLANGDAGILSAVPMKRSLEDAFLAVTKEFGGEGK